MKNGFLYLLFSRTNSWLLAQTDETHVTLKPPSQALLEILYRLICQSCKRQTVLQQVCFLHWEWSKRGCEASEYVYMSEVNVSVAPLSRYELEVWKFGMVTSDQFFWQGQIFWQKLTDVCGWHKPPRPWADKPYFLVASVSNLGGRNFACSLDSR